MSFQKKEVFSITFAVTSPELGSLKNVPTCHWRTILLFPLWPIRVDLSIVLSTRMKWNTSHCLKMALFPFLKVPCKLDPSNNFLLLNRPCFEFPPSWHIWRTLLCILLLAWISPRERRCSSRVKFTLSAFSTFCLAPDWPKRKLNGDWPWSREKIRRRFRCLINLWNNLLISRRTKIQTTIAVTDSPKTETWCWQQQLYMFLILQ